MCGIAGVISLNTDFISSNRLKRMTDSLAHRGPDGEGHWIDINNQVALGHRRLSIIDLTEAGNQPFTSCPSPRMESGDVDRYIIIHNGEVYNYVELKEELLKKGYQFGSQTDTEVIVASYDCWKEKCVDHFDGMFAFAIWDKKEKQLFAARDRFGEKPFFYYWDDKEFLFASEMKALWAAGIERKPNLRMIFNFITIGYVDNPGKPGETFFEQINKLPPASFLTYNISANELIIEKYWDIDPQLQQEIPDEEAIEKFNFLFRTSVKRRLRSDVPVGTSLSGGLDSSSVVETINELKSLYELETSNIKPQTFTAVFPGFEKDESFFSRQVADEFHLTQHTVNATPDGLLNDLEKLFYYQEEPFASASAYAQYKVFELAKQYHVKVLLDGQGADETLAGYHKYYRWYWQELFHQRRLVKSGELKAAKANGVKDKFGVRNIVASLFPDLASVILEKQYLLKALRHEDLDKEFIRSQSKEAYYTTPTIFNLNGILYFNTCMHGLEELLRYADRNSMAHGREVRLPFLNHELVEFIFSLPANLKIRDGWSKWLLRKSMNTKLPTDITWRKGKVGFEPPQKIWMQDKSVGSLIYDARNKLIREKILKPQVIDKPVQALDGDAANNFDWRYLMTALLIN